MEEIMSTYRDFIRDFPARCLDVLEYFHPSAQIRDREVTLLIMAATTAFIIPKERLSQTHLSKDYLEYVELGKDVSWGRPFLSYNLCASPNLWLYGYTQNVQSAPDDWEKFQPISNQCGSEILSILRNALAHGNIYTEGRPISSLLFWSNIMDKSRENVIGHKYIKVPVQEFYEFIKRWVAFLNQ